MSEILYKQR